MWFLDAEIFGAVDDAGASHEPEGHVAPDGRLVGGFAVIPGKWIKEMLEFGILLIRVICGFGIVGIWACCWGS